MDRAQIDEEYRRMAENKGLRYDGMQSRTGGDPLPMFTHPSYGTFVIAEDETLTDALRRKEIQFTKANSQVKE